jgi:hypothetical protein
MDPARAPDSVLVEEKFNEKWLKKSLFLLTTYHHF